VLLVLAAVLLAAIGGGAYWYGWARYTSTPAVEGLPRAEAAQKIDDAGLEVDYAKPVFSMSVDKGDVVSSDPGPGERILPGDTVTVTVSLGEELHDLPNLRGKTVAEAEDALAAVKLIASDNIREVYSEHVGKGQVISTDPEYGTKKAKNLPVNTVIRLTVSKGRQPIKVGDWVGHSFDRAKQVLEGRGLVVTASDHEFSDTVDEGDVISQEPTGGTLFKGDEVRFVVSDGPELIEIPRVFYEPTDQAVQELEDLGFTVEIKHAAIYFTGDRAYSTDPPPGTMAPKGSTVTIYVV
jgi:serine/threonine-protein kinase